MKVEHITVERLQTLGRFNNIKVGISVAVEENEYPDDAFNKALRFVNAKLRLIEANGDARTAEPAQYPYQRLLSPGTRWKHATEGREFTYLGDCPALAEALGLPKGRFYSRANDGRNCHTARYEDDIIVIEPDIPF